MVRMMLPRVLYNGLRLRQLNAFHPSQMSVLILGDSNSALPDARRCWPGLLMRKTVGHIHMVNDSVSGRTTGFDKKKELNTCRILKRRLEWYGRIDYIFIMLGTNDVKIRYGPPPPAKISDNLSLLVRLIAAHQASSQPVLLLPPPIGQKSDGDFHRADERIQEVCSAILTLCNKSELKLIDVNALMDVHSHLQVDGVHLNAIGRQLVADIVYGFLMDDLRIGKKIS